jgi:hypothetical protein
MRELNIGRTKRPIEDTVLLRKFNWGAFFLTWIWALGNRSLDAVTLILLVLCVFPYVGLLSAIALSAYSGITGNRRACRRSLWRDEEHFVKVQRRWALVGAAQFVAAIVLLLVLPFFYEK